MPKRRSIPADTKAARALFFEKGKSPVGRLPDVIARSWLRCAQQLDNERTLPPQRVDSRLLNERRGAHERLRRIVEPEMDALAELVSDSDSLVLLADSDGLILDSTGGLGFLREAERVSLQPGVLWSEQGRGTNAIGTALVERQPVDVRGGQHYLDANGILSCAAAPILTPRGDLLAVLDISGNSEQLHSQALGMVRLAIRIIEHRLIRDVAGSADLLRFHPRHQLLGSHREGVLMLDETRIIGANRAALQLLGANWHDLLDSTAEQWLQLPGYGGDRPRKLVDPRGERQFQGILDCSRSTQVNVPVNPVRSHEDPYYLDPGTEIMLDQARRVLDASVAVLINGETGVGKEVFARRLHTISRRKTGPFVAVNCAALPESLIESELFGYESGAFTGARRKGMPGRVREADRGILFLDEIGDMPLALQARLLRVLQEREVHPLGGGQGVSVDFDLVCASNHDLAAAVTAGEFRADLYYRIQDFGVRLPPLREWTDRRRVIKELMIRLGGGELEVSLSDEALQCMTRYQWPGNLRQLNSTLRTLLALADPGEAIDLKRLPAEIRGKDLADSTTRDEDLENQTRKAIDQALADCNGSVSAAARRLGIHRSTIYRRLSKQRG
ncbi:MAG: sigma-54-dependent Fis family transcriptional regulator [Chromatiaceae bacterium]|nr:sigma-54-dependent Fis family transcriptional regulator [Chromatiaceae bacterium]